MRSCCQAPKAVQTGRRMAPGLAFGLLVNGQWQVVLSATSTHFWASGMTVARQKLGNGQANPAIARWSFCWCLRSLRSCGIPQITNVSYMLVLPCIYQAKKMRAESLIDTANPLVAIAQLV